jgi:hypothetical protein
MENTELLRLRQKHLAYYETILLEIESNKRNSLNSFSDMELYNREKEFFNSLEALIFQHSNESALNEYIRNTKK